MEIAKEIEIVGKDLWLKKQSVLVISDLHIGFENMLNERGQKKVKEVVILGDLKHDFGGISRQEWKETLALLDFLKEKCKKIVLIRGNHDMILEPIARQKNVELRNFYISKDVCFMHGHRMFIECPGKGIKTIVLGHRHPAVVLRDKIKSESYKCFLAGKW